MANDPFGARTMLETGSADVELYSLKTLNENVDGDVFSLPFSIRVMLESLLRNAGGKFVSKEDVEALAGSSSASASMRVKFPLAANRSLRNWTSARSTPYGCSRWMRSRPPTAGIPECQWAWPMPRRPCSRAT